MIGNKCSHPYFRTDPEGRLVCDNCGAIAEKQKCKTCGHETTVITAAVEDKSIKQTQVQKKAPDHPFANA